MFYGYGLDRKICAELAAFLPRRGILNISQPHKLEKFAQKGDLVFFFNWGAGGRKLQKRLSEKGVLLFPEADFSFFLSDKISHLEDADKTTAFALNRRFERGGALRTLQAPDLGSAKTVAKIGHEHQGLGKRLMRPGDLLKTKEDVVFEEFVADARSLRVLILGSEPKDVFVIEHANSERALLNPGTSWIKNVDPDEFVYAFEDQSALGVENISAIVEDARAFARRHGQIHLGIDYAASKEKTGLLEINDMVGFPEDARVRNAAVALYKNLMKRHKGEEQ